jgi:hypothetical protein
MRTVKPLLLAISLAAAAVYSSQQPSQAKQESKTQSSTNEQSNPDSTEQKSARFKLILMSDGVTKSGARWGGKTYETPTHTKVYIITVYLDSHAGAKKEYDNWLKSAVRIVEETKAQDKVDGSEYRSVVMAAVSKDCKEITEILTTVGSDLRIIESCSSDAAFEVEKLAQGK